MAIYTNLREVADNLHGMFESSRLKATVVGHLYDVIVREDETEIAVDNGVCVRVGEYTGDGLQTRYAAVAKAGDKVAVTGSPATVKHAVTRGQEAAYNFYHAAGVVAKAYELVEEDIFAVAKYQFASGDPVVGAYVTVDGNGAYAATTGKPADTYGFVGRVHSIASNDYYPMVRIEVIKNEQV